VRLAVVSDAHGNAAALDLALAALPPDVDEILFAGDAFSDFRFSNDVVERLRAIGARCVLGNHEMSLLAPGGVRARTDPHVRAANLEWVAGRPLSLRTTLGGGRRLLMVHGSPWAPHLDYLTPTSPQLGRCPELDVDFLVVGHSHLPFATRRGRTLVVNPGSIGQSDQPEMGDDVSFAVLDTESGEVGFQRFPNPQLSR
jgi:putative phosphoesterase